MMSPNGVTRFCRRIAWAAQAAVRANMHSGGGGAAGTGSDVSVGRESRQQRPGHRFPIYAANERLKRIPSRPRREF